MGLTFTKSKEGVAGDLRYWAGTITFDDSYPTGGEAITAANFGFSSTIYVLELGKDDGLMFQFDRTNSTIMAYFPTGGASSPTTVGAPTATATLPSGTTTVTSSSANPTPTVTLVAGAGKECGSGCNLSAVIIQVFALGQ